MSSQANDGPGDVDWTVLPVDALLHIFTFLRLKDCCRAAMTCKTFYNIANTSKLWESMKFCFYVPVQGLCVECVQRRGQNMRKVWIDIDQEHDYNRRHALDVISMLQTVATRGIHTLKVTFSGENPCFYSGREFVDALIGLLGPSTIDFDSRLPLLHVDLGQMSVALDDHFIDILSENNPHLQSLNLQTYPTFICKVTPHALARLIKRCRSLDILRVYKSSVSTEVIRLLLESERQPLLKLSLRYTSEDNNSDLVIPGETWALITQSLPTLRVAMSFDETCTCDVILGVHLNPLIPLSCIQMETTALIYDNMSEAITGHYRNTLEELVLMTSIKPRAETLGKALKRVAATCVELTSLVVYTPIS